MVFSLRNRADPALRRVVAPLLALLWLAALVAPAWAQELSLSNLVVDNRQNVVMARFGLRVEGVEDLRRRVLAGETLGLFCQASLYRTRDYWFDRRVAWSEFASVLRYDALSREFVVSLPDRDKPVRDADLATLLKRSWSEIALDLGASRSLDRGERYALELYVGLERVDVPDWLKRSLFFWSWNAAPPARYQLDFTF